METPHPMPLRDVARYAAPSLACKTVSAYPYSLRLRQYFSLRSSESPRHSSSSQISQPTVEVPANTLSSATPHQTMLFTEVVINAAPWAVREAVSPHPPLPRCLLDAHPQRPFSFSISQFYRPIIRASTSASRFPIKKGPPSLVTDLFVPSTTSRIRQSLRSIPPASSPGGDILFGTGSSTVCTVLNSSLLARTQAGLGSCSVKSLGVSWRGHCRWLVDRECWPGSPDSMKISSGMWKGHIILDSLDAQNSRHAPATEVSILTHS